MNEKEWHNLKKVVERVKFGEIRVVIQNGKPIRAENVVQQIKLDDDKAFTNGLDTIALR